MSSINNILVIVDPTAHEHPAIEKAALIAQRCNSRLELFACETKASRAVRHSQHVGRGGAADFISDLRPMLNTLAVTLRDQGLDVSVETCLSDPLHGALLHRMRQTSADLVVKDTHHHSVLQRTFMTNTDWHLIRGCPLPLLLTKGTPWKQVPIVAAAIDPDHVNDKPAVLDDRILEWACLLAKRLAGEVHAVHAFAPIVLAADLAAGPPAMTSMLTPRVLEEERQKVQIQVEQALTKYCSEPKKRTHVKLGVPSEALPRIAAEIGVDILAMGAISRSGLEKIFIGSTAEHVLEHLPCDALIVKSPDFAAELPF